MIVLATSMPVIIAREEGVNKNSGSNLTEVTCIQYAINFRKKFVLALFNLCSEVNALCPIFAKELDLLIRSTNIGVPKIDGIMLDNYKMVVAAFSMTDKINRVRFIEKTFLVASVSPDVVFRIFFFILSGADVDFLG